MTLQSSFCLAIAGVYSNEGAEAYAKKDYSNAVYFATEGIKVNCKDEDLMAIMYNNRAYANLFLGELMCRCLFVLGGGGGANTGQAARSCSELSAHLICNPAEVLGMPFALVTISSVATNLTPCL